MKAGWHFLLHKHAYILFIRYGLPNSPIERGELVPGTYCSRVLDSCHRNRCKIQSPNYPGLYPRNVSCYFTIRQRETPPCKKVLIQVIQLKPHKVQLRSIPGRLNAAAGNAAGLVPATMQDATLQDNFLAWEDCTGSRDGLIIYDGWFLLGLLKCFINFTYKTCAYLLV